MLGNGEANGVLPARDYEDPVYTSPYDGEFGSYTDVSSQ